MPTLTLSMIVKNEEHYLRECLESVKDVVDEIVIVDTGSTDGTIKIAEEFNSKIFHFDWINDFSAARNFALSKSTGNWILYLDADERLEAKSKNELKKIIGTNDKVGVNCIINNIDEYKNSPKLMKYVRLFKNHEKISFTGKAHEQIEPALLNNNYKIIEADIEITHLGYNVPYEKLKEKAERNLKLLLSDYNEHPTSYLAFQIANSYVILEDTESSIKFYREALKDKSLRREFKSVCYLHLADYEMRNNNLGLAKGLINEGLLGDRNHIVLNLIASQIHSRLHEDNRAIAFCKKALRQNEKTKQRKKSNNVIDILVDEKKIIYHGVLLSLNFGEKEAVKFFLEKLKNIDKTESSVLQKLIQNKFIKENEIKKLQNILNENNLEVILKLFENYSDDKIKLDFYSNIYNLYNKNSKYITSFGAYLIKLGQLEEAEIILSSVLDTENMEPAVIFYLISIYIQLGKVKELLEIISIGEKITAKDKELEKQLSRIKNKIAPILESQL